mmetsp:Transcript_79819/g.258637  ORF Transcript_79819/g.258637 Transcript_79819/m.258637 type:complete len:260 (+) Transcript_79819:2473-3252(+)
MRRLAHESLEAVHALLQDGAGVAHRAVILPQATLDLIVQLFLDHLHLVLLPIRRLAEGLFQLRQALLHLRQLLLETCAVLGEPTLHGLRELAVVQLPGGPLVLKVSLHRVANAVSNGLARPRLDRELLPQLAHLLFTEASLLRNLILELGVQDLKPTSHLGKILATRAGVGVPLLLDHNVAGLVEPQFQTALRGRPLRELALEALLQRLHVGFQAVLSLFYAALHRGQAVLEAAKLLCRGRGGLLQVSVQCQGSRGRGR